MADKRSFAVSDFFSVGKPLSFHPLAALGLLRLVKANYFAATVLAFLVSRMDYRNVVVVTQADIAREVGLTGDAVSSAVKHLVSAHWVQKILIRASGLPPIYIVNRRVFRVEAVGSAGFDLADFLSFEFGIPRHLALGVSADFQPITCLPDDVKAMPSDSCESLEVG